MQQKIIEPYSPSVKVQLIRQQLNSVLSIFFANAALDAARAGRKKARELLKAEDDEKRKREIAEAAYSAIYWDILVEDTQKQLQAAGEQAAIESIADFGVASEEAFNVASQIAADYATNRSAEMVGSRWVDNRLVNWPEAQWNIANTTKDGLIDIVDSAIDRKLLADDIENEILDSATFSASRMDMIARTEIAATQMRNGLQMWKWSGKVRRVAVVLSPLHVVYDECDEVAEKGPYPIDSVPLLPLHPICRCGLRAVD